MTVKMLGAVPPWYGRPVRGAVPVARAVCTGGARLPVEGTSTTTVPSVPPGVGCRVMVCVVLPG